MTLHYNDVLLAVYGNCKWSCPLDINDYDAINWVSDNVDAKPSKAVLDLQLVTLQTEWDLTQYSRDRAIAYNERGSTIQNLSVAIVESMDGTDPQKLIDLQVIRAQVKQDFPKP